MKILVTNDDGIDAAGIWAMARALQKNFEVAIAAPMRQQSGMAHAFTVWKKIEFKRAESEIEAWAIDGTPTDCVKFYLEELGKAEKISAVISGINDGANLATDVLYSGTVGGALEGFLHDIPALAVSLVKNSALTFDEVAKITAQYFSEKIHGGEIFFHNLNFPKNFRAGTAEFKSARLGKRDYLNAFVRSTENGKNYFEVRGEIFDTDKSEGTDIFAVEQGFISVTPLHFDVVHYEKIS